MAFSDSVLILWSNTPNDVPTPDQLNLNGRLAVNQYDGKLFYRRTDGTVQTFNFGSSSSGTITADSITDATALGKSLIRAASQTTALTALGITLGTGPNNVIQLDSASKLPAVDGSQLINLPTGGATAIANNRILGNISGATAVPTGLTAAQVKTLLAIATGDVSGLGTAATLNVGTAANNIVQLDASSKLPAVDGSQLTNIPAGTPADGSITTAKLANNAVTYGKMQTQATATFLGNVSGSVAVPAALTAAQVKTALAIAAGDVSGLGTAATLNVGTAANNIVQLNASSKLPAVDGSLLTNLPSSGGGKLVDRAYAELTTAITTSATLPIATQAVNTDGVQVLSVNFTPKNTTNRLRVYFRSIFTSTTNANTLHTSALFSSAASNALDQTVITATVASRMYMMEQMFEYVPGSTSAITISARMGTTGAAPFVINGDGSGNQLAGGVCRAVLIVEEIAP